MSAIPELHWYQYRTLVNSFKLFLSSLNDHLFIQGQPEVLVGHVHQDWRLRSEGSRQCQRQILRQVRLLSQQRRMMTNTFMILMSANTNFFPWTLSNASPENCFYSCYCRGKAEKGAKKDGEIFDAKKEEYKPSEQRKKDQVAIDTQVMKPSTDPRDWKLTIDNLRFLLPSRRTRRGQLWDNIWRLRLLCPRVNFLI